jgi:hypothetical protein
MTLAYGGASEEEDASPQQGIREEAARRLPPQVGRFDAGAACRAP